jgi:hypothetical protein
MKWYKTFEIKWYHLVIGLGAIIGILFVILWLVMSDRQISCFHEDDTDIVN